MHTPTICITGGPCAGKTTALGFLNEELTKLGFTVILISEVATEIIVSGINPALINPIDFKRQVLKSMIEKERRWRTMTDLLLADKKVIICDRGIMDGAAYLSAQDFTDVLQEFGCNVTDVNTGYDAVIFLRSLATDAPHLYQCTNNAARSASVERAHWLDTNTLASWHNHPHLTIISNGFGVDNKLQQVLMETLRILCPEQVCS